MISFAEKYIQGGILALLLLMPFHAFLSVWLGALTGKQSLIQSWKEILLLTMAAAALYLVYRKPSYRAKIRHPLIWLISAYGIYSVILTFILGQELVPAAFGIKTNFGYLLALILAYLVATKGLIRQSRTIILTTSAAVAAFAALLATVLPRDFLTRFGYGPETVLPYQLLTANVDAIRIPSTLGGANQLGSFLILPLALVVMLMIKKFRWWQPLLFLLLTFALMHTFSRSAWVGAIAAVLLTIFLHLNRKMKFVFAAGIAFAAILAAIALVGAIKADHPIEDYVLHGTAETYKVAGSDSERSDSQERGINLILTQPIGYGLGTSGPASTRDTMPVITENLYLQIGIETGLLGLILFIGIMVALGLYLLRSESVPDSKPLLAALVGISLINLVLHGWADSSTSLIYFAFAGLVLGGDYKRESHTPEEEA